MDLPDMNESLLDKAATRGSSIKLPFPLSELENKPRTTFQKKEIQHYIGFWSGVGACAGFGVGVLAFYRRHRYRMWVRKQPQAVQLKILEKNNIIANPGIKPQTATTRFSNVPNAIDTRIELPYSRVYRPYQWYEWGPLKIWNNLAYYPWASEMFMEIGKWSIRLSLLTGLTLCIESSVCLLFGYPLGSNLFIRGTSGTMTGYLVAKIASEGVLFWYQNIGIAFALGSLWMFATWYSPNWGELARDNKFILELYSSGLHKHVQKHFLAKEKVKELYAKDMKEKQLIYDELLEQYEEDNNSVDRVDIAVAGANPAVSWNYYRNKVSNIKISKEIEEMPYEQRKDLEQKVIGESIAIDYTVWPFSLLRRYAPQWFTLNKDKIISDNDTTKLIQSIQENNNDNHNQFTMDSENEMFDTAENSLQQNDDLSILS